MQRKDPSKNITALSNQIRRLELHQAALIYGAARFLQRKNKLKNEVEQTLKSLEETREQFVNHTLNLAQDRKHTAKMAEKIDSYTKNQEKLQKTHDEKKHAFEILQQQESKFFSAAKERREKLENRHIFLRAMREGFFKIVREHRVKNLREKLRPQFISLVENGETKIMMSLVRRYPDIFTDDLINTQASKTKFTALHWLMQKGSLADVQQLLKLNPNPLLLDEKKRTPRQLLQRDCQRRPEFKELKDLMQKAEKEYSPPGPRKDVLLAGRLSLS